MKLRTSVMVVIEHERPIDAVLEDLGDLVRGAAEGYVGDPDRPLGGANLVSVEYWDHSERADR